MSNITFDKYSLIINGKRRIIISGSLHYYRLPAKELWKDRLLKMKEAGLDAVEIYFPWNYHSEKEGVYDFSGNRDVDYLLNLIEEIGLYLIARPGPYICSEIDAGGFPGWLLTKKDVVLRCRNKGEFEYSPEYMKYVKEWYNQIVPKIAKHNNLILFQIENEYNPLPYQKGILAFFTDLFRSFNPKILMAIANHPLFKKAAINYIKKTKIKGLSNRYMQELKKLAHELGIKVPIFHNDTISFGARQLDVDIMAIDDYSINYFNYDWRGNEYIFSTLDIIEEGVDSFNTNSPVFVAEFQAGWYDTWGGCGYDKIRKILGINQLDLATKTIIAHRATIFNYYTFCGGTTYGYLSSPDVYTSYDFASPIDEAGNKTERYYVIKWLIEFIKEYENELVKTDIDNSITSSNKKIFCKARMSTNKKFVFLRNLSKREKTTKLNIYKDEIKLNPCEMKVFVFNKENNLEKVLESFSKEEIISGKKKSLTATELVSWKFSFVSPQLNIDYDDSTWPLIKNKNMMDIDTCGVHYGYIWYRGKFTGKLKTIKIDARHLYSIYINSKLIFSYDNFANFYGIGKDFARTKIIKVPEKYIDEKENVIVVLVESLGHNKDFEEDARNPRGIIKIETNPALPITWRYRGGLIKGEGGLTPVVDFEKIERENEPKEVTLPHIFQEPDKCLGAYETEFDRKDNTSIGLVIQEAKSKANIYLNGFLIGRYWQRRGPQKKFYLPEGILKQGKNYLTVIVWKREKEAKLDKVYIEEYEII